MRAKLLRVCEWNGLVVRLKEDRKEGFEYDVPAGTVMLVTHAHNGLSLHGVPCGCCGRMAQLCVDSDRVDVVWDHPQTVREIERRYREGWDVRTLRRVGFAAGRTRWWTEDDARAKASEGGRQR